MTIISQSAHNIIKQTGQRAQSRYYAAHIKWLGFQLYLVIYDREKGIMKNRTSRQRVPSAVFDGRLPLGGSKRLRGPLPCCSIILILQN